MNVVNLSLTNNGKEICILTVRQNLIVHKPLCFITITLCEIFDFIYYKLDLPIKTDSTILLFGIPITVLQITGGDPSFYPAIKNVELIIDLKTYEFLFGENTL